LPYQKKLPIRYNSRLGNKRKTNNAVWETWADDPFTFPAMPDPNKPPQWRDRNKGVSLEQIQQLNLRAAKFGPLIHEPQPQAIISGSGEVVFRNKSSFDFIIKNQLFFTQGLVAAFKRATNASGFSSGLKVAFDLAAIELKAVYRPLDSKLTKQNCHWNVDQNGKEVGLVALHIMTKQLPNWTWATFEWSGNTPDHPNGNSGRSDWYGSRDSFGAIYRDSAGRPSQFQPPAATQNQPYSSGSVTKELQEMFKDAEYTDEWTAEWSNYRLKGSQTDFIDNSGEATLVGNSVTESGFVQTSSCITCHGNASVDHAGSQNPSIGFTLDGQSRNGPLNPGWFLDLNSFDPSQEFGRYKINYVPLDFVWAFFRARPAASP
jgi:hypothetical protein